MRSLPLPLTVNPPGILLLATVALQAQSPWENFLNTHRRHQASGPLWRILVREDEFQGPWRNEGWIREARGGKELAIDELPEDVAQALWADRGWGEEPHWVLMAPSGEIVEASVSEPEPDALLGAMRSRGWTPPSVRFEDFIRNHRSQGEAWAERFEQVVHNLTSDLVQAGAVGKEENSDTGVWLTFDIPTIEAQGIPASGLGRAPWDDAARVLKGLAACPGWTGQSSLFFALWGMGLIGGARNPAIEGALRAMLPQLESDALRQLDQEAIWQNWAAVASILPGEPGPLASNPEPLPGGTGASLAGAEFWRIVANLFSQRIDPLIRLSHSERYWNAPWPEEAWTPKSWEAERVFRIQVWGRFRHRALKDLRRDSEANALVEEMQRLAGTSWQKIDIPEVTRNAQALAYPDPPFPAGAQSSVLRLVGFGYPEEAWEGLRKSPEMEPWIHGDLTFERPKVAASTLHDENGAPVAGWALYRGDQRLMEAHGVIEPQALAQQLPQWHTPRLETLNRFIRTHPDRLDARRQRFHMLVERMPDARYEPTLAQDAELLLLPPPSKESWKPSPGLWVPVSRRALSRLEAHLISWPSDSDALDAWLGWSELAPTPPDFSALFESLTPWEPRSRWAAGFSQRTASRIASLLARRQRWEALRRWCQARWDGIGPSVLKEVAQAEDEDAAEKQSLLVDTILRPWLQALTKLKLEPEAAVLKEEAERVGLRIR